MLFIINAELQKYIYTDSAWKLFIKILIEFQIYVVHIGNNIFLQ